MMDLSGEERDVLTTMRVDVKESEDFIGVCRRQINNNYRFSNHDGIINLSKISFEDDETWLYESLLKNSDVKDLKGWLYQDYIDLKDLNYHGRRLSLTHDKNAVKKIDSRTFTRPKKRINRPSIEHYNERYSKTDKTDTSFDTMNDTVSLNEETENMVEIVKSKKNENLAPLCFDYTQPTSNCIFDKISNASDLDSFQNMSPPSLVNSMCSSTFTNLMENSYIKNDPTLREIRDADFTEAMLQDYDPPLFKSFTDSCSSISSDSVDAKKVGDSSTSTIIVEPDSSYEKESPFNKTYPADSTAYFDCTYQKDNTSTVTSSTNVCLSTGTNKQSTISNHQSSKINPDGTFVKTTSTSPILSGTFIKNRSTKHSNTFRKSPQQNNEERISNDLNRTITIIDNVDLSHLNNIKRQSLILDSHKDDSNNVINSKRNSIACSTGSTDSLDYSSLSNSSRGSNKMLNMAEVDAIVLQQEQSLQVMSTPKNVNKSIGKLWGNSCISPIKPMKQQKNFSDSESSSNDDFCTVTSSTSNIMASLESEPHATRNKSLEDFKNNIDIVKMNPKSLNSVPLETSSNKQNDNKFRGSYTNLKTIGAQLKGSYTNLHVQSANTKGSCTNITSDNCNNKDSSTNLKTMSNNLKASYTKLKPTLTDLPNTNLKLPDPNATITISRNTNKGSEGPIRIAQLQVAPTLRDRPKVQTKHTVTSAIRPPARASCLPRPVSAIPRPTGSRIPCPRSDRPASQRQFGHPVSRINVDGDF